MELIDLTKSYNGKKYLKYLTQAINNIPFEDLKNIDRLNLYDCCPKNYPIIVQGGHYPATPKKKGAIDIYLDQNFGHLLSYNYPKGLITKLFDLVFIHTFGKLHLIHTVFHEVGHQVFEDQKKKKGKRAEKQSEKFAEEYASNLYRKMYPSLQKRYQLFNSIYHSLFTLRIDHDNKMRRNK